MSRSMVLALRIEIPDEHIVGPVTAQLLADRVRYDAEITVREVLDPNVLHRVKVAVWGVPEFEDE